MRGEKGLFLHGCRTDRAQRKLEVPMRGGYHPSLRAIATSTSIVSGSRARRRSHVTVSLDSRRLDCESADRDQPWTCSKTAPEGTQLHTVVLR